MMFNQKSQCTECTISSSCPSNTKVFVNYCGSMATIMKEQIHVAVADCRKRRLDGKYHLVPLASKAVTTSAIIFNTPLLYKECTAA